MTAGPARTATAPPGHPSAPVRPSASAHPSASVYVADTGDVRTIRLDRPERRNALDMQLAGELADAIEGGREAGAIVLSAAGNHFCVGGDLAAFAAAADVGRFVHDLAAEFHRAVRAIVAGPPVVVAVRGWAAGAGMSTVLACDVVVGGHSATFRPAYPGIGLTPDGGMSWTLPRIVGVRHATSLMIRNKAIDATTAASLGIIHESVEDAEADATAHRIAHDLAAGPRTALRGIKRLVADGALHNLDDQLDAEARSIAARASSAEGREGTAAFLQRRPADYAGTA